MKQLLNSRKVSALGIRAFKVLPVSSRFGAGKLAVRLFKPFSRRFARLSPPPFALDTQADYLWLALFTSLTYKGIEFDPQIQVRQLKEDIPNGAIFVSGHFFLNYFLIRWLYDNGYKQSIVIRDEHDFHRVIGTNDKIDVIKPNAESLLEIKKRIKAGEIISICVDHHEPLEGWQKLNIPNRSIYISDIIFKFAERLEIPLVFFGTKINADKEIEVYTARPNSTKSNNMTAEFAAFLKTLLTDPEK
jgi:hypothetical protein